MCDTPDEELNNASIPIQSKNFIVRKTKQSPNKYEPVDMSKIKEKRLSLESMRNDPRRKVPLAFLTPESPDLTDKATLL
jgi:hypothetical protein